MSMPTKLKTTSLAMGECNDCTVIAVAVAAGVDYEVAHEAMHRAGRRKGRGAQLTVVWRALRSLGFEVECLRTKYARRVAAEGVAIAERPPAWVHRAKTATSLGAFLPARGNLLALTSRRRHILACRGGKVLDWTEGRRHRIDEIYRVKRAAYATPYNQ